MSFAWPEFDTKQPLDGGRSWTAQFDSYDQYRDDCYYRVRIFDGDQPLAEIMVQVGIELAGDDWTRPQFAEELRARIARVAATGNTNTDYAS